MRTISKQASRTLAALVQTAKAGGQDYAKIDNNGPESAIMPVSVERVYTAHVEGCELWAVCHTYVQNGDLMRDPEIVYCIPVQGDALIFDYAYPIEYRQDNLGIFRTLVAFKDGRASDYRPAAQADTARFSTTWMRNIKRQQGIQ